MYLDAAGLVALWREALLARAVLRGETVGYRHHPQLHRFRECGTPRSAINAYIAAVYAGARARGYRFDSSKMGRVATVQHMLITRAQLKYEWSRLLAKLRHRDAAVYRVNRRVSSPVAHPLCVVVPGPICRWECIDDRAAPRDR